MEEHRIEAHVKVWLTHRDHVWEIDRNNLDGHPLNGATPTAKECECDDQDGCARRTTSTPTAPTTTERHLTSAIRHL